MNRERIEDWWDDIVYNLRHIKWNIYTFLRGLHRWFSYRKTLMKAYDYDYTSILEVEKLQMTRVRDCIAKYHNHIGWECDVRDMNIALKLLDIIEEEGCSELIGDSYKMPIYVNTRNYKRIWEYFDPKMFEDSRYGGLWKDSLRVEKAWNLYHKLRLYCLRNWWN